MLLTNAKLFLGEKKNCILERIKPSYLQLINFSTTEKYSETNNSKKKKFAMAGLDMEILQERYNNFRCDSLREFLSQKIIE
jgi:hypothetical protein